MCTSQDRRTSKPLRLKTHMILRACCVGPIPPELGRLGALKRLYLGRNQLTGECFLIQVGMFLFVGFFSSRSPIALPTRLELAFVTEVSVATFHAGDALAGSIPLEICAARTLLWLDLSNNQLSGEPKYVSYRDSRVAECF